jgi:LysR family transcriptional regulator, cyn operon transcriptional activator
MGHDINLRQLRAFVKACEIGNVSKAAKLLHLTQPALSRQIQQLEAHLEIRLFDRSDRRIRLTSEGQELLARSRDLLAGSESLIARAETLRRGHSGVLRVGASSMTLESFIAPVIARYRRLQPEIEVRLLEEGGFRLLDGVERGDLHLAVTVPLNPRLASQPLFPMRTLAVRAASNAAARGKTVRLEDLAKESLLVLRKGFVHRQVFDATCEAAHLRPRIQFESTIPQTLIALARINFGIAVLPSVQPFNNLRLRVQPIVHRGYSMGSWMAVSWDTRRFLPSYGKAFIEELVAEARRNFPGQSYEFAPPVPRTAGTALSS